MQTIVIKCGGSILAELSDSFFNSIKELKNSGYNVVVVHGGGPKIGQTLASLNIESEFVNGLRKTTKEVLDVAEMVLSGMVNKKVVIELEKSGIPSIGLSGCDAKLMKAKPINLEQLGYVGEIEQVNVSFLEFLLSQNYVPVISPIGFDVDFTKYNINADSAAASVAIALKAEHLLFVTDVDGIIKDGEVQPSLSTESVLTLIEEGTIYGGMIPKVNAALSALRDGGLNEITIINGKDSLLSMDGTLKGTKIVKELEVV
ncbi:acetylglutamate kinase [Bacillus sp. REN16]|uniref:acetylglutamate kinase n=1 Tax=Bacillus sp. REN16 TaxID=2887296 RepID=UPI001E4D7EE6|nr:acetylglutamate kinase [Bacillus sp. REN16]MCC3355589.1 acetylglutamate kinase [Bacillus sp. REN16]